MDINQFKNSAWFNDNFLKTLIFLERIDEKDETAKQQFLGGLAKIIKKFDSVVIINRILPRLLLIMQDEQLSTVILPSLIQILEIEGCVSKSFFQENIWPPLKRLCSGKEIPAQALYIIVCDLDNLIDYLELEQLQDVIMPLMFKAYECEVPQLQEQILGKTPCFVKKVEYTFLKTKVLPRVLFCVSSTKNPSVRIKALFVLKDVLKLFDRTTVNESILPVLEKVKKVDSSPEVCMHLLKIYESISESMGYEITATKLLPALAPTLIESNLGRSQFVTYIKTIRTLIDRIEEERMKTFGSVEDGAEEDTSLPDFMSSSDDKKVESKAKTSTTGAVAASGGAFGGAAMATGGGGEDFDFLSMFDDPLPQSSSNTTSNTMANPDIGTNLPTTNTANSGFGGMSGMMSSSSTTSTTSASSRSTTAMTSSATTGTTTTAAASATFGATKLSATDMNSFFNDFDSSASKKSEPKKLEAPIKTAITSKQTTASSSATAGWGNDFFDSSDANSSKTAKKSPMRLGAGAGVGAMNTTVKKSDDPFGNMNFGEGSSGAGATMGSMNAMSSGLGNMTLSSGGSSSGGSGMLLSGNASGGNIMSFGSGPSGGGSAMNFGNLGGTQTTGNSGNAMGFGNLSGNQGGGNAVSFGNQAGGTGNAMSFGNQTGGTGNAMNFGNLGGSQTGGNAMGFSNLGGNQASAGNSMNFGNLGGNQAAGGGNAMNYGNLGGNQVGGNAMNFGGNLGFGAMGMGSSTTNNTTTSNTANVGWGSMMNTSGQGATSMNAMSTFGNNQTNQTNNPFGNTSGTNSVPTKKKNSDDDFFSQFN
mmetsp:Transcript_25114/g.28700  ORF Transcript_25114/g.28700 Transcript_25114/m.28700 type:complete len:815 (-) Transcript_25114:102-2546(-)